MSDASDLLIGLHLALQEKLQALSRIKSHKEVSGVGQKHDKPISYCPGQSFLHPVHLCLLPREKGQLMVSLSLLLAILLGPNRDGAVTALKSITLEPPVDLRTLQKGILLIPLINQLLIGSKDRIRIRAQNSFIVNHLGDSLTGHPKLLGYLPDTQMLYFIQMPDLAPNRRFHESPPRLCF
jgi:hypothetical protein